MDGPDLIQPIRFNGLETTIMHNLNFYEAKSIFFLSMVLQHVNSPKVHLPPKHLVLVGNEISSSASVSCRLLSHSLQYIPEKIFGTNFGGRLREGLISINVLENIVIVFKYFSGIFFVRVYVA